MVVAVEVPISSAADASMAEDDTLPGKRTVCPTRPIVIVVAVLVPISITPLASIIEDDTFPGKDTVWFARPIVMTVVSDVPIFIVVEALMVSAPSPVNCVAVNVRAAVATPVPRIKSIKTRPNESLRSFLIYSKLFILLFFYATLKIAIVLLSIYSTTT